MNLRTAVNLFKLLGALALLGLPLLLLIGCATPAPQQTTPFPLPQPRYSVDSPQHGAVVARVAHTHEVVGSIPTAATNLHP